MLRRILLLASCLIAAQASVQAQAPRTISYQGLLTDGSGEPVPDGVRSMTFRFHRSETAVGSIWQEIQDVATTNGIFNVQLGAVNPITIDLSGDLWLSVRVESSPQLSPRTQLVSALRAIGLVMPYRDSLKVETANLGTDGSESVNEDVTVHANDAFLGLYSNAGGVAGSGIQLGEITAGALTNKWSIYRETSGAGSSLLFTYGEDAAYSQNPVRFEVELDGDLVATGEFKYDSPRTRKLQLPAAAFRLDGDRALTEEQVDWREVNGYIVCYSCVLGGETFTAPVYLPDGAEVKSFTLYYMDNDLNHDTEFDFTIWRRALLSSGLQGFGTSPVTSSGASTDIQTKTISTTSNANRFIDTDSYMYFATVHIDHVSSASWSARRFYGMTIEYEIGRTD